jgi:DNA-binding transcriptional regulator YdaS (Cro superfamily)
MMLPILQEAIRRAGGVTALAESIGLTRSALYQWKRRIPAERVMDIERETGIDRTRLRPDLYKTESGKKRRGK